MDFEVDGVYSNRIGNIGGVMPIYKYKALTESGVVITGEEASVSDEVLAQELERKGLLLQHVKEKRSISLNTLSKQNVKPQELLLFNQEFIALVKAGLPIAQALELTADRPGQLQLSQILRRVLDEVQVGVAISDACSQHSEVFDSLYLSALKTGERTGDIVSVLQRYQSYLRRKIALGKKIKHALTYPLFLMVTLVIVLGLMFAFVMPRFVKMYGDFEAELPYPTQVLMGITENLHIYVPVIAVLFFVLWGGYQIWVSSVSGRILMDEVKERLPLIGELVRQHAIAQMTRTLSTLLAGGTNLLDAMHATRSSMSNKSYASRMDTAIQEVVAGVSLSGSFTKAKLLTSTAIKMIEAGEASGSLSELLADVAEYYEESVEYQITKITSLVEPALMLLMGIMVGGIIVVMYLPIFSMANIIQ